MNETAKKVILAVVIVAAGAFAVMGAMKLFKSEEPIVERRIEGDPNKSMKKMEMEAQKRGTAVGESVGNGAPVRGERDLGDLPGKG